MKKIIITPGITDLNRGDQALIWLIKDILQEEGIEVQAKLLQSGNTEKDINLQSKQSKEMDYDVITPLILHPARNKETKSIGYSPIVKVRWGMTALGDFFNTSMLLSKNRFLNKLGKKKLNSQQKRTYDNFNNMDILIVKGGGFLHTYKRVTDIYYLYYSLFDIMLAHRLGKKVIIMPNSFGPFLGKIERRIVKQVLKKCETIYAREDISREYLQELLNKEVKLSPDLGFYIKPNFKKNYYELSSMAKGKKKVAITMRPYRFPEYSDGEERYKNYINEMYLTCKELIRKGYFPIFVAHTLGPSAHEDDRIALNGVIKKLRTDGISESDYLYYDKPEMNCFDITDFYAQVDYIIGTRFHSVIFAMTSLTPSIAISYSGHKTTGIMEDIGLKKYVINIGEVESKELLSKFSMLVKETDNIKSKLTNYFDNCKSEKKDLVSEVRQIMQ